MRFCAAIWMVLAGTGVSVGQAALPTGSGQQVGQSVAPSRRAAAPQHTAKDDELRGGYGPYRANNDLLSYDLTIKVDPSDETIHGTNRVRFRMLQDGQKIQLELDPAMKVRGIMGSGVALKFEREGGTFWVELPRVVKAGEFYEFNVGFSGHPVSQGRFGCFSWDKDKQGKPWVTTSCEDDGASVWWPNKEQWKDKPQGGMILHVVVPDGLTAVANGRFVESSVIGDGFTIWSWQVHAPINNYDVALNIGAYEHFGGEHVNKETGQRTTLDYYVMPENLERAKVQFAQVPEMLDAFEHYFGEYPFDEDGYKLVEVPYAGMEHQSAVAYGNHYENGYDARAPRGSAPEDMKLRDWTKVGISPKFDFIIIHESGHEWFGNAVTAADKSDMWIHEGWTTYMESLYVEYRWGKDEALRYLNGRRSIVDNKAPIITAKGSNQQPGRDQYDKGGLMINTLRSVWGPGENRWDAALPDFFREFRGQTIATEDVVAWWSDRTSMDLKPFFDEYLRHAAIPALELRFDAVKRTVDYRWKAEESAFAMPIQVGDPKDWTWITPVTTQWKTMPWTGTEESFQVPVDLFYVNVVKE